MSEPSLYLLHTQPDARLLAAWVARHHQRHERQPSDLGDALHGLLRAAFGEAAPQPFRYLDERQGLWPTPRWMPMRCECRWRRQG